MNKKYCDWALKSELEKKYHDEEWGKPVFDDKKFFEIKKEPPTARFQGK